MSKPYEIRLIEKFKGGLMHLKSTNINDYEITSLIILGQLYGINHPERLQVFRLKMKIKSKRKASRNIPDLVKKMGLY